MSSLSQCHTTFQLIAYQLEVLDHTLVATCVAKELLQEKTNSIFQRITNTSFVHSELYRFFSLTLVSPSVTPLLRERRCRIL